MKKEKEEQSRVTPDSLEQRHATARKNPPPYAVRKQLREATLAIGRRQRGNR